MRSMRIIVRAIGPRRPRTDGRGCWRGSRKTASYESVFPAEINFNVIGDPRRDSTTEEIAILGPDRQIERQRSRDYRPVHRDRAAVFDLAPDPREARTNLD